MSEAYQKLLSQLLKESSSQGSFINLERSEKLSLKLGSPEKAFPVIHIAGSNGKGSTATKIAAGLREGGYKTALYTSPHLFSFRERMQINGICISKEEIFDILSTIYEISKRENISPTFFELTTFLAFEWFRRQKVDVAVIEVGLGGALDATNVVNPILSIITSISIEHADRLGDTEEKIAIQKAGIIKRGVPVLLGVKATQAPILSKVKEMQSALLLAKSSGGWYDVDNQNLAKTALEFLRESFPCISCDLARALAIRPPCRFEMIDGILFDVAHNLEGFTYLYEGIEKCFPGMKIRLVLGLSKDKDIEGCLQLAAKKAVFIHLVEGDTSKAVSMNVLARVLQKTSYPFFSLERSVLEGVKKAKEAANSSGELLVIAGSFYIMRDAKRALCDDFDGSLFS